MSSRVASCAASLRNTTPSLVSLVTEAAPRKTPLYDEHMRLGAKIVPFAGWLMPVQYTSIVEEHRAVRNNLGIFDISHMGQLIVDGPTCARLAQYHAHKQCREARYRHGAIHVSAKPARRHH